MGTHVALSKTDTTQYKWTLAKNFYPAHCSLTVWSIIDPVDVKNVFQRKDNRPVDLYDRAHLKLFTQIIVFD